MIRFLLCGALVFFLLGCSLKNFGDMVIPKNDEKLQRYSALYNQKVKECDAHEFSLAIFMERAPNTPNDLWREDVLIQITPKLEENPTVLTLYHKTSYDSRGKKIERTFLEFFLIESFISEETLMPHKIDAPPKGVAKKVLEKLRNIFPSRDLTVKNFHDFSVSIAASYMTVVENCIEIQ